MAARGRLDDDLLVGGVREAGVLDGALRGLGLAVAEVGLRGLLLGDLEADGERQEHEGQPPEDGGLAMPGAPTADAAGEVETGLHGGSLLEVDDGPRTVVESSPPDIRGGPSTHSL